MQTAQTLEQKYTDDIDTTRTIYKDKYIMTHISLFSFQINDLQASPEEVDNFKQVKILCIGDIMLDRFLYGSVDRISPEAPVPVFNLKEEKEMLGGAGNVVANLASLTCQTSFIGIVGKDAAGKHISNILQEKNITAHLLSIDTPTIKKTRVISSNNHLLRLDHEEIITLNDSMEKELEKLFLQEIPLADIVLISDYQKGLLTHKITQTIIQLCNKYNKKVIVDPKGKDFSKYSGATLIKPNLKEFCKAMGVQIFPKDSDFTQKILQEAKKLFAKHKILSLMITLSEHGMIYISSENPEQYLHIPTEAKEIFDVSGAGDTSLATLGASLASQMNMKDSMMLANIASGIVVGKVGTACVTPSELKASLSQKIPQSTLSLQNKKIITLEQAVSIVKDLKNKTIGFTNGCFDCLHLGHIHSFMQIKQLCDVLIVGLNSDSSVKKNKGESRPLQDEKTRSILLASMEFIDYVIIFDDSTALNLVEKLQPNIIAKEGYSLDQWPEGQYVQNHGGKAIALEKLEGYSTTGMLEKVLR